MPFLLFFMPINSWLLLACILVVRTRIFTNKALTIRKTFFFQRLRPRPSKLGLGKLQYMQSSSLSAYSWPLKHHLLAILYIAIGGYLFKKVSVKFH